MARTRTSKSDPADRHEHTGESGGQGPNPVWFKPVMFGFMLLGLVWILVFYVSGGVFPVQQFDSWNILIGFGIMFIGFLMTTRWR